MGKPSTNRFGALPNKKPNRHRLRKLGAKPFRYSDYTEEEPTKEEKRNMLRAYQTYRERYLGLGIDSL